MRKPRLLKFRRYIKKKVANLLQAPSLLIAKVKMWEMIHTADAEYRRYLNIQLSASFSRNQSMELQNRTVNLVNCILKLLPKNTQQWEILCVGCRNHFELDYIRKATGGAVTGMDLFSEDPAIKIGDMHSMPFKDSMFDVIYACHSLEHSYDSKKALAEFKRVVKSGGMMVIEVPVQFVPSATDRQDFGSAQNLIQSIGHEVDKVLMCEETMRSVHGQDKKDARVVVSIHKGQKSNAA
jgi:SAM-dependent methyltransferase